MHAALKAFGDAVLILQLHVHPRYHAQHGHMNQCLQHPQPRLQKLHISPELVDEHALHPGAFFIGQQHHRAQQRSKHAAQIDIAHQNHRCVRCLGHRHVDNVAFPQIDLRRAAGALDDHAVHSAFQLVVGVLDPFAQRRFVLMVFHGCHGAHGFAVHDHLTAAVAGGLEEHRIHPHVRLHPRRLCLRDLRPTHLESIAGDEGIERHVLRLEWRGMQPVLLHDAQQRRAQHALAHR